MTTETPTILPTIPSPFHTIVVTSPDSDAASAAIRGPLHSSHLPDNVQETWSHIISTSDPFDTRMGSGGGTLAAVEMADRGENAVNDDFHEISTAYTGPTTTSTCGHISDSSTINPETMDGTATGEEIMRGSVLIIHAGGQSSRCPTQMTLGKAWTDIPIINERKNTNVVDTCININTNDTKTSTSTLTNPTYILMESLSELLQNLPSGSIVVAASDVLLDLYRNGEGPLSFDCIGHDKVLGLAVPAPLMTAKSHGVFAIDAMQEASRNGTLTGDADADDNDNDIGLEANNSFEQIQSPEKDSFRKIKVPTEIRPVDTFFQKPSVDTMKHFPGCVWLQKDDDEQHDQPGHSNDADKEDRERAWIDTGVVIFLPGAAEELRDMARKNFSNYTAKGLEEQMEEMHKNTNTDFDTEPSKLQQSKAQIQALAQSFIPSKLELYSHLLLAIPTRGARRNFSESERLAEYLSQHESNTRDPFPRELLLNIFHRMEQFELQVCAIASGSFVHLGTTMDLLQFYLGENTNSSDVASAKRNIRLAKRVNCFLNGVTTSRKSVVLNSIVDSIANDDTVGDTSNSEIASHSVVEHCHLERMKIRVGSFCVVSGVRGRWNSTLEIPSRTVFHMLPLRAHTETDDKFNTTALGNRSYVCMFLGVEDEIKKYGTYFGIPFDQFLEETGLASEDLWCETDTKHHLWNARVHPVITIPDEGDAIMDWEPFRWIKEYLEGPNARSKTGKSSVQSSFSLELWKSLRRLSLADIQGAADASSEFSYRSNLKDLEVPRKLEGSIQAISNILVSRWHQEISFDFILNSLNIESVHDGHGNSADISNGDGFTYSVEYQRTYEMLREVILSKAKKGLYDICSRCFMLLSEICTDIANILGSEISFIHSSNINDYVQKGSLASHLESLKTFSADPHLDCSAILAHVHSEIQEGLRSSNPTTIEYCATALEDAAFALTSRCVTSSIPPLTMEPLAMAPFGSWVVSNAPARVDLSGGWSDTPPVSYEYGGAVACMAVTLKGRKPLSARCRRVKGLDGIILTVENRNIDTGEILDSESITLRAVKDLADFRNPRAKCALAKCALIALGVVPISVINAENPQLLMREYLRGSGALPDSETFGLELISTSLLPQGSGLGTSSILAGCVLSSLGRCLGVDKVEDRSYLIRAVLNLEQLLSTGGGWQDQVGGLYGGLKLCSAEVNVFPVHVHVEEHEIPEETVIEMNQRLLLAFSGKPRLAKNILQKVLRQWARRSPEIIQTVQDLVIGANECIEAIRCRDFAGLGNFMNLYWSQKKIMAGRDSGAEPNEIRLIFETLISKGVIDGATLAGAGGGGFMAVLLSEGQTVQDVKEMVKTIPDIDDGLLKWYDCNVCSEGLRAFVVENSGNEFHLKWHAEEIQVGWS